MKKILALILAAIMLLALVSCGEAAKTAEADKTEDAGKADANIKVGFIFLHDESSTYDKNFMNGAREAQEKLGLTDDQVIFKYPIEEGKACYDAAADLVDEGCNIVFADSFGHEEWMIKAAKEFKDVQFCHATGVKAHTEKLDNYHNAFASIYEGRYLAGIVAGMKLNAMIEAGEFTEDEAVIGYVGAFPYAEVVSGYTSFFLGARSVCPKATMLVDFTNSWYSVDAERDVANALMDKGAKLISQHADSQGAPAACEARKVPNVFYNGSNLATQPNTYLVASRINWAPYFEYMINCVKEGKAIATDWTGTLETGSVVLEEINDKVAAPGTKEAVEKAMKELKDGTLKVFATDTFTVDGEVKDSYLADVDDAGDFVGETEAIKDGFFHESEYRSAPYFDLAIDGITKLSAN